MAKGDVLMAEVLDTFSFEKGINTRKAPAFLSDGEMQSCSGFSLDNDGYINPFVPKVKKDSTAYGTIRNLHRYMNTVLMSEGENIRYAWDLRGYCDQYIPPDNEYVFLGTGFASRYRFVDYNGWIFGVNGRKNVAFSKDILFQWGVDNPKEKCAGTAGAGGNPNGTYNLYYTYLVIFPTGMEYETGPSAPASVTVSSQAITWSGIGICPYSGSGVTIHRKLYRYSSGLAATYYVTTIADNTTTTYSDDATDASLQTNDVISVESFSTPPEGMRDIELYLYRMFGIKNEYLYWSEPYMPFGFKTTSSINVSGNELTCAMFWGDQLYIADKKKWFRLSGSDPDSWGIKQTFSDTGIINTHTVKATKYGILGLWHDGIYIFDGSITKNITEKKIGMALFTDTITDKNICHAEYDGLKYYFYYSDVGGDINKCLVIDFTFYPDIRFYHDPFIATAHDYHHDTGRRYLARLDNAT